MTTFTDGIKSALNKPVQAVTKGLQWIRNKLPFSDAKEGPLSQLTLSGRKVLTTFANGIQQEEKLPAEIVNQSFEGMNFDISSKAPKTSKEKKQERKSSDEGGRTIIKKTTIENLTIPVDLKKLKDIKALLQLIEEIEDFTNSNGSDEDPELQPA